MATEIKVWQIKQDKLVLLEESMEDANKKEVEHLEQWIKSNPEILGDDIILLGEQIPTTSGRLDFLALDSIGNTIIVELKRGMLSREVLVQSIDYASDVANWDINKLDNVHDDYTGANLVNSFSKKFPDVDVNDINFNGAQRILIVGCTIEDTLQRMIEWLSRSYDVSINVVLLKYIKTEGDVELIARTMIIPEEEEIEKTRIRRRQTTMKVDVEFYRKIETLLKEKLPKEYGNFTVEHTPTWNRVLWGDNHKSVPYFFGVYVERSGIGVYCIPGGVDIGVKDWTLTHSEQLEKELGSDISINKHAEISRELLRDITVQAINEEQLSNLADTLKEWILCLKCEFDKLKKAKNKS